MSDAVVRARALQGLADQMRGCRACRLREARTTVVAGAGDPDAGLMLVGEAPGAAEDRTGLPFVGRAGALLDSLLQGIGLSREQVFITNVVRCRPPGNRNPRADEIEACRGFLAEQVQLVRPGVICTLGNVATRLLSGRTDGIGALHGQSLPARLAGVRVTLYPVHHPAAALRSPAILDTMRNDFAGLAGLLACAAMRPAPVPRRRRSRP